MYEWSDEQQMIRTAVRDFIERELVPIHDELEHGDTPPYDLLRRFFAAFGMDAMAREGFKRRIEREKAIAAGEIDPDADKEERDGGGAMAGMTMIPIIELCRYSPGLVTAMGVSMGLTAAAINSRGTIAQKERWAAPLLTMEKIGAWAITEPGLRLRRVRLDEEHRARATATSTCSTDRRRSSPTAPTPTRSCSSASSTRATRPRSARS